jgi:uncharacterized membrane protein YdbT with pleckstrin-like domain
MSFTETELHAKLPIGKDEKILEIIKHHWFAYASIYIGAGMLCLLLFIAIIFVAASQNQLGLSDNAVAGVVVFGVIFTAIVALFSMVPVWMRKQEALVLTEEALLQLQKPTLFSNHVSQTNIAHVNDVTVRQNTLGTMLGFGSLMIETPGEQNNYSFTVVAKPHERAKMIIEAHENYSAALESGQIHTTLGTKPAHIPGSEPALKQEPQSDSPENPSTS